MLGRIFSSRSRPYWVAVALPAFVGIVLTTAVGLHTIYRIFDHYHTAAAQDLETTAISIASAIEREIEEGSAAISRLGETDLFRDVATSYEIAKAVGEAFAGWVVLVDDGGRRVFNTSLPYGTVPPSSALIQNLIDTAMLSGERVISGIVQGNRIRAPFSNIVVPIKRVRNGQPAIAGALVLSIPHSRFTELLQRHAPGQKATVLVDGNGRVVASYFPQPTWRPSDELPARQIWDQLRGSTGHRQQRLSIVSPGGLEVVGSDIALTFAGWRAVALTPKDDFENNWSKSVFDLLWFGALLILLSSLAAVGVARLVTIPIRKLVAAASVAHTAPASLAEPISIFREIEALRLALADGTAAVWRQTEAEARVKAVEQVAAKGQEEVDYLRLAQEVGGIGTFSVDFRTRKFLWSNQLWLLRGFDPRAANLAYEDLADLIHPEDRMNTVWGRRASGLIEAPQARYEEEFRAWKPNIQAWVRIRAITYVTYSAAGDVETMVGVQMDTTERWTAEQELRSTHERLQVAQDAAGIGVFSRDAVTGERIWSEQAYRLRGYDPQGQTPSWEEFASHVLPEDRHRILASLIEQEGAQGKSERDIRTEYRIRNAQTGEVHWHEVFARAYFTPEGKLLRWVGAFLDTTERHRVADEARAAMETFRLAQSASGAGIFERCLKTDVATWSPERYWMLGYPADQPPPPLAELRSRIIEEISSPIPYDSWNFGGKTSDISDFRIEVAYRHAVTGETRWVLETGRILRNADGAAEKVVAISIDITELRRTQVELAEGELRMQFAEELSGFGLFERNFEAGTARWSKGLRKIWGFAEEDDAPLPPHAEIQAMFLEDGEHKGMAACAVQPPTADEIAQGRKVNIEFRIRRPSDGTTRWLHCVGLILFSSQGKVRRWFGAQIDVTEQRRNLEALRLSQNRLALAQDAAGIGFFERYVNTGEAFWSEYSFRIRGLDPAGPVPGIEESLDFVVPEDRANSISAVLKTGLLEAGKPISRVVRIINQSTRQARHFLVVWKLIINEDGQPVVIGAEIDIEQQIQAEQALRESEARLRLAQKVAGMGVFERDLMTGEGVWSEEMYRMRGYDSETANLSLELMRNDVVEEDQHLSLRALLAQKRYATGDLLETSFRLRRGSDREVRNVIIRATVLDGPSGPATKVVGVMLDITDQARAVENLRASEERFRLVAASMQGGIFDRDLLTGEVMHSDEYYRIIGRPRDTLKKPSQGDRIFLREHVHPDDLPAVEEARRHALYSGAPGYHIEYRARHPGGHWIYIANQAIIVRDQHGQPIRTVGSIVDITGRREAEAALRQSEERLRLAQEHAGIGVFEINFQEKTRTWSNELYQMFGLDPVNPTEAFETITAFAIPEDRDRTVVVMLQQCAVPETRAVRTEYRGRHVDGTIKHFLTSARGFWDETGALTKIIGIQIDISELKRAEGEVRRYAELSRLSLAAAEAGFWEMDIQQGTLDWSPETFALLGRDPALGEPPASEWDGSVHPDDQATTRQIVEDIIADPSQTLRTEFRVIRPDGSVIWLLSMGSVTVDSDGRPRIMRGILVDITERREAEQAQALLIREVDHRAKNALASVLPILRLTKAETMQGYIDAVEARVSALARAHNLLARSKWSGASIKSLLDEELAPYTGPARNVILDGPNIRVKASSVQALSMALHEMTINAAKYGSLSAPEGALSVSWRFVEGVDGSGLEIFWKETGGPMIETPPRHRGFGSTLIGMTIKRQLGGSAETIWHAEGAEWRLFLPEAIVLRGPGAILSKGSQRSPTADAATVVRPGSVLLVDDEVMIALVIEEIMIEGGWDVVGPAASLDEAVALYEANPHIALALLDVNLKGEMVFPLARRLRDNGIPLVFMTGYGAHPDLEEFRATSIILTKPVLPGQIWAAVEDAMLRFRAMALH